MKKKKVFVSILFSYIAIMIIPMVILGAVIFDFFNNFYEKEALSSRVNNLHRMQIAVDARIREMNAHAYMIFNSPEFSASHLLEQYGNFLDITRRLSSISSTNDFISLPLYITNEMKLVFTPETMYSYMRFKDYDSGYRISEEDEIPALLVKNLRSYWLPVRYADDGSKKVLTYVVTNKIGVGEPRSSMAYQINPDTLTRLAGEFLAGPESGIMICDYDDNLLFASDRAITDAALPVLRAYKDKKNDKPIKANINGKMFVMIPNFSSVGLIKYVSVIPYQSILTQINHYKMLFNISILLITVVCAFFISYFMRINYVPIRTLSRLAASIFGDAQNNINEIEATQNALIQINESNASMMRDKITLKLIRGGYDTLEAFERESGRFAYKLTGPYFRVIEFSISKRGTDKTKNLPPNQFYELANFIENTLEVNVDACAVDYSEGDAIFVVASGLEEELEELGGKLEQIKNVIENAFSILVSIGVGNIAKIDAVKESTSQAMTACKYQFVRGKGSIVFYKEIEDKPNKKSDYPNHALDALYHSILNGEEERVQFAINTLVKYISDSSSLFLGTCLAYDTLNTVMKAMREMHCSFSLLDRNEIIKDENIKSIDDIIQIVNIITNEIVEFISQNNITQNEAVAESNFEQIMKYISLNYMKETFSVKVLADHCNMSISNLSHFFKKQTGQTISDYIALLKISKAKELLRTSDMNLQEISSICGYIHLSTFMRQFKQHENTTPINYRNQNKFNKCQSIQN